MNTQCSSSVPAKNNFKLKNNSNPDQKKLIQMDSNLNEITQKQYPIDTRKQNNLNVYVFTKTKNQWVEIGTLNESSITYKYQTQNSTIREINLKILELIKFIPLGHEGTLQCNCGPTNDLMTLVFLPCLVYRRSVIYPIIQYSHSTKNVRLLAYGINIVLHDADCFGTSLDNVINCIDRDIFDSLATELKKRSFILPEDAINKLKTSNYLMHI